ncbi:BTAD domain-containing putative transcriptional regulator [Actinosynnema sp. NPDC047251]|uniref:Transcriptional regulator, SARP family n=1 Tax=Saccharothrix espanaensis (strain ATCC 51144 / DSM 44229 / JCM 9112 / NBRC 15066 / NRRL 15764) TaxID=1179773 RepID=K0JUM5_SACES|nr:BTAD domain-containing putative transcriptional regulator [Saccharothrix espanaensis]CCH29611.1 Transcriptional regulator, SARP family [Saccharothrix espanaensis DSM 44229]
MTVEFRLLGEIEATVDGRPVDVGSAKGRCLLAVLLIDVDHPVSVDRLVDRVWGGQRVPRRPAAIVQSYLSRLRRGLAPAAGVRIVRLSNGYRLTADPRTVDLHDFRRLTRDARAAPRDEDAEELYERALALWRGDPFGSLDVPWLNVVRSTLVDELHAARLDLVDVRLRLGDHAALLADLAARARRHPLDERVAGQLMLALHRSGRSADALAHYDGLRRRLVEELGTDPGAPIRRLHQQIITADPAPALARTPTDASPGPSPGFSLGPPGGTPVPRQLPSAPRLFAGRAAELAFLTTTLGRHVDAGTTVVITAIGGIGGIGKTWLALHWAHRNLDRFPDGQLFVNLRGFDPLDAPIPPATVVRRFLDALGVVPAAVPVDLDAQFGLYRSLVSGRRMLIVLDNARDSAQVVPLLPGSPTCAVLVTSRSRLTGLCANHSAFAADLDRLSDGEARNLLVRRLGRDRVDAEPGAAAELLDCCAGLPLALGVVAARAAAHPDFPLATLAAELRDVANRLDALDTGDLTANVRSVLACSYQALDAVAARVFALLGVAPGPDLGLLAAASLCALPVARCRNVLRELEEMHLVQQHVPDRYRMHDLVRLYAAEQGRQDLSADERDAALHRLVDCYTHTAYAGDRLLEPHRPPIGLDPPAEGCAPARLADADAAAGWFAVEGSCLVAAQQAAADRGWHTEVWRLSWVLHTFRGRQGLFHDLIDGWRVGLAAARELDALGPQIQAHRHLGTAHSRIRRHQLGFEHLGQALALAELAGDLQAQAHCHHGLTAHWELVEDHEQALRHAMAALRLYRELGDPVAEARALNHAGWEYAMLGSYEDARSFCEQALTLNRQHWDSDGEAATLDSLGYIAGQTGGHTVAVRHLREALEVSRRIGNAFLEVDVLEHLGVAHLALGEHAEARTAWQRAIELCRSQRRAPDAERVQRRLDELTAAQRRQDR